MTRNPAKASKLETCFVNLFKLFRQGQPLPEAEYRFHPVRKWRFDFAWPAHKVAVELEGGVKFIRAGSAQQTGRHTQAAGFIADCDKYNAATLLGWRVFRFTNKHLNHGTESLRCIEMVMKALSET